MRGLFRSLLKWVYRKSITRVTVLRSDRHAQYERIPPFCVIEMETEYGSFLFHFKRDVRRKKRSRDWFSSEYLIQLNPPDTLTSEQDNLRLKIVLVVMWFTFNLNKELLTEVLSEVYLDSLLQSTTSSEPGSKDF